MLVIKAVNVGFVNDCTWIFFHIRVEELKIIKVMDVIINRNSWDDLLTTSFVTRSPHLQQMRV